MPHNLPELWEAQIDLLNGKPIELFPDYLQGGLMDVSAYDDGAGKVEVRARIKVRDPKHVVIEEIPYGTTTESIIASIENAAQKGRLKISSIDDFTTDRVEIDITVARGTQAKELIPQLYAYTDCSVSISSNLNLIKGRRPVQMTVTAILKELTDGLVAQLKAELEYERDQLIDRQHWLTLEQIFVEKRVYKRIETAKTEQSVKDEVNTGMAKFEDMFIRPMIDDDVRRLLEIRIRRISAYDINKNRKTIDDIIKGIKEINVKLKRMKRTAIQYVEALIKKYAEQFPRRTHITRIVAVDKKAVATNNIKLAYDRDTGFFGSAVRGDLFRMSVSEFDFILGIASDGTYRVMTPVDKVFFSGKLIHCEVFDPEEGAEFMVVYRDKKKIPYGKRIKIHKFIRNKEYQLIKNREGKVDLLFAPRDIGTVKMDSTPAKRQRLKEADFDLSTLEQTGPAARGARLAPKPVSKIKYVPAKASSKPASKAAKTDAGNSPKPKAAAKKKAPAKKSGGGSGPEQGDLF